MPTKHKAGKREFVFFSATSNRKVLKMIKTNEEQYIQVQGQPERIICFQYRIPKHKAGNYCQKKKIFVQSNQENRC